MSARTTPEPEPPKRLSLSRALELALGRGGRQHSSVSLSRTATGAIGIDVTVIAGEGDDALSVEAAAKRAKTVFAGLRNAFPEPEPHDQAEVSLTRNAKGDTQIAVSAKTHSAGVRSVADLEQEVRTVYDATRMKYPMADGHSA